MAVRRFIGISACTENVYRTYLYVLYVCVVGGVVNMFKTRSKVFKKKKNVPRRSLKGSAKLECFFFFLKIFKFLPSCATRVEIYIFCEEEKILCRLKILPKTLLSGHRIVHRQTLAAKKLSTGYKNALDEIVKIINF